MKPDNEVRGAVESAARALEVTPDIWDVCEKPYFHDAFRAGLSRYFGGDVLPTERRLRINDWEAALVGVTGALGGVDVLVVKTPSDYLLLAELKWCRGKKEMWWTLWDIYKLVAAQQQHSPEASYAVVGAPLTYWQDSTIDCSGLFESETWDSRQLFRENWRAWRDLLVGGKARPSRIPAAISTELIASEPLASTPAFEIRAVRVDAASDEWVAFVGDWPAELTAVDRPVEATRDDRVRGCLLGGAVGDALGAPVEFLSLAQIRQQFGPDGVRAFAPAYGREGAITDDTQMTLFTAEGLMRAHNRMVSKGICHVPTIVWQAYRRWLHTQGVQIEDDAYALDGWLVDVPELHNRRAPGNTCLSALAGGTPGSYTELLNDSKGCGGVMRIAPVGILTPGDAYDNGCEIAALTHSHPSGYLSAGYLAELIARLAAGEPLWNAAVDTFERLQPHHVSDQVIMAVEKALDLAARSAPSPEAVESLGQGWVAEEALGISLYCALVAEDFREGVLLAVNHGGDSDSTGAITGNILGARLGVGAIPGEWLAGLELRDVIESVADDLLAHVDGKNIHQPEGGWGEVEPADWERYPGW